MRFDNMDENPSTNMINPNKGGLVAIGFFLIASVHLFKSGYPIPFFWITSFETFIVSAVVFLIVFVLVCIKLIIPFIKSP